MAQQTAVEWIAEKMEKLIPPGNQIAIYIMLEQAKQMEKDQIIKAFQSSKIPYKYDANLTLNGFEDAEQYYNETFGNQ